MDTEISDVEAWRRLRLAITAMMVGSACLIGVVQIITAS